MKKLGAGSFGGKRNVEKDFGWTFPRRVTTRAMQASKIDENNGTTTDEDDEKFENSLKRRQGWR